MRFIPENIPSVIVALLIIVFPFWLIVKIVKKQAQKEEQVKKQKESEYHARVSAIAARYGISTTNMDSEAIKNAIYHHAITSYTEKRNAFYEQNNITSPIVDTDSDLNCCTVSDSMFFHNIRTDMGKAFHHAYHCSWAYSLDKIEQYLKSKNSMQFLYKSILLDDILMFKVNGNRHYITEVAGGGANIDAALVGGALFGGAGAIIGSQAGTEIKSETKEIDDRSISLYYYSNGQLIVKSINSTNFDLTLSALRELIPQKEDTVVNLAHNNSHR